MGVSLFKYEEKLHLSTETILLLFCTFMSIFLSKILHLEKSCFNAKNAI